MANIAELKPIIRALLLALGRAATEREICDEYRKQEGQSFNQVWRSLGYNKALEFLQQMPDVCGFSTDVDGNLLIYASHEKTKHLDHLTIKKKKKRGIKRPRDQAPRPRNFKSRAMVNVPRPANNP